MTRAVLNTFSRSVVAVLSVLLGLGVALNTAAAHPALDEAKHLASDLEFEASLGAFQRALDSGELTREELVELLAERAFVLHALKRKDELVEDFVWLSALAPDYRLDLRAPPDLTATWTSVRDQGRGELSVTLVAESDARGEVEARATLSGTVPEGAQARLWVRREGGEFRVLPEPEFHAQPTQSAPLSFYAQAVGLGDVVVAQDHGPSDPLRLVPTPAPEAVTAAPREDSPSWARRHRAALWGTTAAVVVAAAVLTTVFVVRAQSDQSSDDTHLTPMVSF